MAAIHAETRDVPTFEAAIEWCRKQGLGPHLRVLDRDGSAEVPDAPRPLRLVDLTIGDRRFWAFLAWLESHRGLWTLSIDPMEICTSAASDPARSFARFGLSKMLRAVQNGSGGRPKMTALRG